MECENHSTSVSQTIMYVKSATYRPSPKKSKNNCPRAAEALIVMHVHPNFRWCCSSQGMYTDGSQCAWTSPRRAGILHLNCVKPLIKSSGIFHLLKECIRNLRNPQTVVNTQSDTSTAKRPFKSGTKITDQPVDSSSIDACTRRNYKTSKLPPVERGTRTRAPVSWWRANSVRTSGSSSQFSINWEGSSCSITN